MELFQDLRLFLKTIRYFLLIWTVALLTNCKSKDLTILQVDFKADACFGTCPIFDMTISKDGKAKYNAQLFNERQGQFTATIKKPQLDSLTTLIERASLSSLMSTYSTLETDQPTYSLTVKFKNGQTKTIKDYGPSGPNKLEKIYKLIFSLRESQDWK